MGGDGGIFAYRSELVKVKKVDKPQVCCGYTAFVPTPRLSLTPTT
jgi:hypothetical protein